MTVFILGNCVVVLDNSFSTNGNDAEKTVFVWDFPLIISYHYTKKRQIIITFLNDYKNLRYTSFIAHM